MAKIKLGKWEVEEEELEREFEEAERRGRESLERDPHARSVRYDRKSRRVVLELTSGCLLMVPVSLMQGLSEARSVDLAEVRLLGVGQAIEWPRLDQQFSVKGLVSGLFGTKAWMAELGRRGGASVSEAKRAAARANGKKGGRPPKLRGKYADVPTSSEAFAARKLEEIRHERKK